MNTKTFNEKLDIYTLKKMIVIYSKSLEKIKNNERLEELVLDSIEKCFEEIAHINLKIASQSLYEN